MKLLLIRHGETVDNVAGLYAGITDSSLTVHGVLQTKKLGQHLAERYGPFAGIFCSDLQRAQRTAQAILDACLERRAAGVPGNGNSDTTPASLLDGETNDDRDPTLPGIPRVPSSPSAADIINPCSNLSILPVLREQDFGSLERRSWSAANTSSLASSSTSVINVGDPAYVAPESKSSMDARATTFISDFILPLLIVEPDATIAVVSHGILLSRLWKRLLALCPAPGLKLADNVVIGPRGVEHLGAWSNTGVLELDVGFLAGVEGQTRGLVGERFSGDGGRNGESLGHEVGIGDEAGVGAPAARDDSGAVDDGSGGLKNESADQEMWISIFVRAVNSTVHLASLKRTRGGIGSSAHDASQGTLDNFFKRRRTK